MKEFHLYIILVPSIKTFIPLLSYCQIATYLFIFKYLFIWPHGMWTLGSPTRD